jgi:glycosyltransferase involved in cell wall biosynthesis
MHLGIDASNIRQGGGLTHLAQLLAAAEPGQSGFERVTVWCNQQVAGTLASRPWLQTESLPWMEAGLLRRIIGQQWRLPRLMAAKGCDILFSPGGTSPAGCKLPVVTMSQNMLPFEPEEAARFGRLHFMRLKMWLLRQSQGRSFKRAQGVLFLTEYARRTVSGFLGGLAAMQVVVPHGIEPRFVRAPRQQMPASHYTMQQPFKVLYVSILMPYKHQIKVAEAASALRARGVPIQIEFIGESWGQYGPAFRRCIEQLDPQGDYLIWKGAAPFATLAARYHAADAFVFASSCENLPNIMIEAMAAGLPIASSSRGPMPEVLGEQGCYFDPDAASSIEHALHRLLESASWRQSLAEDAWRRVGQYSWPRCAHETLNFIAEVYKFSRKGNRAP